MWAYRSNDLQARPRIIVFDYQPGRSGSHARGFLGNWRGHLLVDDYAGYSAIAPALLYLLHPCSRRRCLTLTAKALDYSLKRWPSLSRYAETGHLPIDNNPVENCIRPIALGKKNWLFVGAERAGQRAAAIQTLLGTAKLNGVNSAEWLKDTLENLPTWPNSCIDELLPLAPDVIEAFKLNGTKW